MKSFLQHTDAVQFQAQPLIVYPFSSYIPCKDNTRIWTNKCYKKASWKDPSDCLLNQRLYKSCGRVWEKEKWLQIQYKGCLTKRFVCYALKKWVYKLDKFYLKHILLILYLTMWSAIGRLQIFEKETIVKSEENVLKLHLKKLQARNDLEH